MFSDQPHGITGNRVVHDRRADVEIGEVVRIEVQVGLRNVVDQVLDAVSQKGEIEMLA